MGYNDQYIFTLSPSSLTGIGPKGTPVGAERHF